jgi:transposase-like protein
LVKINGKQHYLWRVVDQDGEVVDVYLQAKRDGVAGFRQFKSVSQAQRFLGDHTAVSNLFNLGRHLVRAEHYRNLRVSALEE